MSKTFNPYGKSIVPCMMFMKKKMNKVSGKSSKYSYVSREKKSGKWRVTILTGEGSVYAYHDNEDHAAHEANLLNQHHGVLI